ncbi:MAG: SH3 domain-containing protein [Methylotenera sp.]|nr:SH3 domain-containing protein [Methylotenera sp.]
MVSWYEYMHPKILSIFEQSNQFLKVAEQHESFSKLISNVKEATKLYHLDALEYIANLQNSPLNSFSELANESYLERLYSSSLKDLDKEIISEIGQSSDFEKLPLNVQSKIIQYIKFIFITIILNLLSSYIYDQRGIILQSLKDMTEPSQVKSFVRNGSSKYPRDVLKGLRVVSGKNVNLRTEPSMKSEIILQLDTGTLIEVLDKTNRSWLLVEVSNSEEVIQGWIARRYTVHFK